MGKYDSPEGQEAWSKLQVCARDAHALDRHKNTVEFIGFCPDCQATGQARYDDVTCGYCDRPLVDREDSTGVCDCL